MDGQSPESMLKLPIYPPFFLEMAIFIPIFCVQDSGDEMDSKAVIKAIEAEGWYEDRQKGSHKQFRHPTKPGLVTVPHPKRDLAPGTLRSIERQAGVNLRHR